MKNNVEQTGKHAMGTPFGGNRGMHNSKGQGGRDFDRESDDRFIRSEERKEREYSKGGTDFKPDMKSQMKVEKRGGLTGRSNSGTTRIPIHYSGSTQERGVN